MASAPADVGVTAVLVQLASRWTFVLIAGAVVVLAFLVNRFAPRKRRRIGRVVSIFALYLIAVGAAAALDATGASAWATRIHIVADLLEAFTVVNIAGLAVFDLALPAVKVDLVTLTSDLLIGLAYIATTIGILHGAGMELSSVIATSAIVSGVLALSLQATLGNILGGVALQLDGSIHVGDWVQLDTRKGKVKEIRWRHTVLETLDWDTIIVPNASLLSSNITILGKRDGTTVPHRMWVYFNVDFRFPPERVVRVVEDALRASPIPRVAPDPPPNCICMDFARDGRDSFGYYAVRYFLTDISADDPTSSDVRDRVWAALKRAGIPLAKPAHAVFMTPDDDLSHEKRKERHRQSRLGALRGLELFKSLTDEERSAVTAHLKYAPFGAGEIMTRQGAVAHWLYILATGKAEVRVSGEDGTTKTVATIEGPSYFGEMGLMAGEPRFASVVAVTDAECYRLDKIGFEKILRERPEIAREISQLLAKRRVEIIAIREGLDAAAQRAREASEQARILERMKSFFGLSS
jgi:small-conductance mechanosensitive channel/CRP-like cAMP-binding protein